MKTERQGQAFGRRCWKKGHSSEETLRLAMAECELTDLPDDVASWPRFLHGAEEGWHDLQTEHELEMEKLAGICDRYQRSEKKKPARD